MYKQLLVNFNLLKKNYKDKYIPVVGGIILMISTITSWYMLFILNLVNPDILNLNIFIILVIGTTGLLDDICGDKQAQGFKGHFKSLLNGNLTTGIFKILITTLVSIFVLIELKIYNIPGIIINAGIIILTTNFLNLLDLRPARSIKAFIGISFLLIMINISSIIYFLPFFIVLVFYLPYELQAKIMLGDSGANLLGAILGFNTIIIIDTLIIKFIVLLFLLFLNLLSEKYSYSSIIEKNFILSWIDRLGR